MFSTSFDPIYIFLEIETQGHGRTNIWIQKSIELHLQPYEISLYFILPTMSYFFDSVKICEAVEIDKQLLHEGLCFKYASKFFLVR